MAETCEVCGRKYHKGTLAQLAALYAGASVNVCGNSGSDQCKAIGYEREKQANTRLREAMGEATADALRVRAALRGLIDGDNGTCLFCDACLDDDGHHKGCPARSAAAVLKVAPTSDSATLRNPPAEEKAP